MKIPNYVSWESTLKCPLRCKHCGLSAGLMKPGELSTIQAKKMFLDLSIFGVKNLVISGGEFTIRPDWLEILRTALLLFESVRVITCGWLGKDLFTHLIGLENLDRLTISVSLDGLKDNHDLRRGQGSFDKAWKTLTFPTPIPRTVLTTVDNLNMIDCPQILQICLNLRIPLWCIQISLPAGRMKGELFLGKTKILILAEAIVSWQQSFGNRIEIAPDDCFANLFPQRAWGKWDGCHAGKNLITVLSDGRVTGCPTMRNVIAGNVINDSLEKIWDSKIMRSLRTDRLPECITCNQCSGGCRAVSGLLQQQFCLIN